MMDNSSELHTSKSLPLPGTSYICLEINELDKPAESPYVLLASELIHEWLDETLEYYEHAHDGMLCQSDGCVSNVGNNENQICSRSGDMVNSSLPTLKQLCLRTLEMSDMHVMDFSVSQFSGAEKQVFGRCENGTDMIVNSLSCNQLATNVQPKQLRRKCCSSFSEFNADLHISETEKFYRHRSLIRHTRSETSLQQSVKKSVFTLDQSQYNSMQNSLKVCNLQILPTSMCEDANDNHKILKNVIVGNRAVHPILASGSQLMSDVSLNMASSGAENLVGSFTVNSDCACSSAHIHGSMKCDLTDQDPSEHVAGKVTGSFSDTVLSEYWNLGNSGAHLYLSGPGVQVSL